jgi:hypothetical protein
MQKIGQRVLLLALIGLLLAPVAVHAELKANSAVYAWDVTALKYQNSNVIVYWDGTWVPFVHELGWDNAAFDTTPYGGCGITQYAGIMEFGLYHTDNAPEGAPGFQETDHWRIVDCDRDRDGRFDGDDLQAQPPQGFTVYRILAPLTRDQVVPCGTGNCLNEIVTTLYINLDTDCNGAIDPGVPTHACFYAEARTPLELHVTWGQTLQARVTAGGGDKTVSFDPRDPPTLQVELLSFDAAPQGKGIRVTWETAAEIDNSGFNLYRAESLKGVKSKLNVNLIPSQVPPGNPMGASYKFVDGTVQSKVTYYYWLEAVDIYGKTELFGPVSATAQSPSLEPSKPSLTGFGR